MVSKDIQELAKEKYALETEISQKEIDIRIKSGEIKSLQSELDTLAATLKQLENQKGEAMKRLGDLKAQVSQLYKLLKRALYTLLYIIVCLLLLIQLRLLILIDANLPNRCVARINRFRRVFHFLIAHIYTVAACDNVKN